MVILYFRVFLKYTGTIPGALHFAQVMYWYTYLGHSFHKPIKETKQYSKSTTLSWCEELGISYDVLYRSMKQTCTRLKRGKKYDLRECGLILYWKESYGQIFFVPNYPRIALLSDLHPVLEKSFPHFKNWLVQFSKLEKPTFEIVFDRFENWNLQVSYIKENTNETTNKTTNEKCFPIDSTFVKNVDESKKEKGSAQKEIIVVPFDSMAFAKVWTAWKEFRAKKFKKPYSDEAEMAALFPLRNYTEEFSINLITKAISNDWKDFHFEDTLLKFKKFNDDKRNSTSGDFEPHVADLLR